MQAYVEFPNIYIQGTITTNYSDGSSTSMSYEGYDTEIILLLSRLRWTYTGWCVMCEILRQAGRRMIIRPWQHQAYYSSAGVLEQYNATAGPEDFLKANPKNRPVYICGGEHVGKRLRVPGTLFSPGEKDALGHGGGTNTIVRFSPNMWDTENSAFKGIGTKKDEILFHEMCHGMRQMAGTMSCAPTPDQPGYDTLEEFIAIVLSNILRSELGRPKLRKDHAGFAELPAEQEDPAVFLAVDKDKATNNKSRLLEFKKDHPKLFADLCARQIAKFNPVRLLA